MIKRTVLLFLLLTAGFQNCSQVHFTPFQIDEENLKSENGTGYGGKPDGDFYRFNPDFRCENKEAPVSHLHIASEEIQYTENKRLQCGAVQQNLDSKLIDSSIYQKDVVGYKEGIFEGEATTPQSIPANLVEVWCRTSKDASGIETITHFNRVTAQADTEIYHTLATGPVRQTLTVSRVISAQRVTVRDGRDFNLEVYRDQPAAEFGLFQGKLQVLIDGQKVSVDTSCRLGGSVDSKIWPALEIVDTAIDLFKVSSDRTFFGYTSSLAGRPARLYSADINGMSTSAVSPPMLVAGVKSFEITPDLGSFVYWGDPRYSNGIELFKVNRDGSNPIQLNQLLTNSQQGQETDIQFSADGRMVYYRDGQQETGVEGGADIEMWLRAVPLNGGTPFVVNPPLPLVGDQGVYHFELSKNKGKIAYLAGGTSPKLFIADLDGKNVFEPLPGLTFLWYEKFTIPDPGSYLFIRSEPVSANGSLDTVQYAVAMDGTGHVAFPANWDLNQINPKGANALIADTKNSTSVGGKTFSPLKWVDLKTGIVKDLPLMANAFFSRDGASVIGVKVGATGVSSPISYSWSNGVEVNLCPSAVGEGNFIKEVADQTYFISSYDNSKKILSFFIRDRSGACQLKNSIPALQPQVQDVVSSPDSAKVLVQVSSTIENVVHDQLYYIPLSGEAGLAVNSAVYWGAHVKSFQFLNDSRTVLYFGDQITPAVQNAYLWRAP